MSEQDRPVELPIPDEVACVGGVSQAIYTANSVRAAIRADRAAAPQPQPAQASDLNLSCKSVQARLAAQWGYAPAQASAQVLEARQKIVSALCAHPNAVPTLLEEARDLLGAAIRKLKSSS